MHHHEISGIELIIGLAVIGAWVTLALFFGIYAIICAIKGDPK